MKCALRLAHPPPSPVLAYDGEWGFCWLWIQRWRSITGERVEYVSFQDERISRDFPELPRAALETAAHFLEVDGSVYSGAEAGFRALAHNPDRTSLFRWYQQSPLFADLTEKGYRFVATHRRFFSFLTRVGWGTHLELPAYHLVRWAFLRCLGIIYLIAFLSLWVQIRPLIGSDGILPARLTMDSLRQQADAQKLGFDRYHLLPTLCWFRTTDGFLKYQCAAGTALSILVIIGLAPAPCLFLLWLIYLSLTTVCFTFLGFQWDNLLLETGLLAIFFAPLQLVPRIYAGPPSRAVHWLLRWLLFRLMFQSGCVKLLSADPSWSNLTALSVHYETQPLPTWIGWYAHQLPLSAQKISTAVMFFIELVIPFLVFGPRRLRQFACVAFIALQVLIMLTGNYCFFNLLTIALCLLLLDDAAVSKFIPKSLYKPCTTASTLQRSDPSTVRPLKWPIQITVPLVCISVAISLLEFSGMFRIPIPWPRPVLAVYQWLAPLRSFNSYGLFAVMTD